MTIFEKVGKNIERVLMEKGLTQVSLAEKLGVSKQVMNKIIQGNKAINVAEISRISHILGIPIEDLINVQEDKKPVHHFSYMGQIKNEKTRQKVEFLKNVIDEILFLEEYANEC